MLSKVKGIGLTKVFRLGFFGHKLVNAVDGVDIFLEEGGKACLIGESGSGKTTLARILLMLLKPTGGEVFFNGNELTTLPESKLRKFRRRMQMVPQHPEAFLDPKWFVYDSIAEPLRLHGLVDCKSEELERVMEITEFVGLKPEHLRRRPRDLSGGELQRVVITRALILHPEFLVADEPTSMLDLPTQAKILDILLKLHKRMHFTLLFITHDFKIARYMSDYVYVMYSGKIVEEGEVRDVFEEPIHPYTTSLVKGLVYGFEGARGWVKCPFYKCCQMRLKVCLEKSPKMFKVDGRRKVRCWIYGEEK